MPAVKPSWKKLETWLITASIGYAMYLVNKIVSDGPGALGLPPQYSALVATVLAAGAPALLAWFAKLRHDAYANAGLQDPNGPIAKALVALAIGAALFHPLPARADASPQLVFEPTPAMVVWHPGNVHPVSVAAASGAFAGVDLFPTTLFGQSLHVLSVGADLFGSYVAAQQAAGYGALGVQIVLYEALTLMASVDLYASDKTGVFGQSFSGANVGVGIGVDLMLLYRLLPLHQTPVVQVAPPS